MNSNQCKLKKKGYYYIPNDVLFTTNECLIKISLVFFTVFGSISKNLVYCL